MKTVKDAFEAQTRGRMYVTRSRDCGDALHIEYNYGTKQFHFDVNNTKSYDAQFVVNLDSMTNGTNSTMLERVNEILKDSHSSLIVENNETLLGIVNYLANHRDTVLGYTNKALSVNNVSKKGNLIGINSFKSCAARFKAEEELETAVTAKVH